MMKRKMLSVLLMCGLVVSLATGCGASGNTADDAAETENAAEPAEAETEPSEEDETESAYQVTDLVGTPTDYSDSENWAHLPEQGDKPVDTFFVYPTVYINPSEDAPAIVPVEDETLRAGVASNYERQASIFEDLTNLYEPYYRQTNLAVLIGKDAQEFMEFQYQEQRTDVYAALDYYFEHYNDGKPFILAGHSQGSMMLKIALTDYFKEHTDYLERMVAAYVIGFSITTDDLETNPLLKFAEGADDTGVIVSWNTEGPENDGQANAVVTEHAIAINPITWTRDETKADASENLGSHIPMTEADGDTIFADEVPGVADATVNTERGVVICTTLSDSYITVEALGEDAANPFGPASLHNMDYAAYWENIRENVQTRIQAYQDANE